VANQNIKKSNLQLRSFNFQSLISNFLKFISNFLIFAGLAYIGLGFYPVLQAELGYLWITHFPPTTQPSNYPTIEPSNHSAILWSDLLEPPINTEFSIVIPKLRVNAPVVADVPAANEPAYLAALKSGVAHAQDTATPSTEPGNTYLFAHSTPNIFDIQKYSAVFTLLNKLETGDRVILFHKNQRFDYTVSTNEVVESFNLTPLTRQVESPTLTLQTCDPPGVPINRRIVTAELVDIAGSKQNDDF